MMRLFKTQSTFGIALLVILTILLTDGFALAADAPGAHGDPTLIGPPSTGMAPAITTLIVFVALLLVLSKFAWGPIASGLKAREDKIRADIADAEAARAKAEATLKEYSTRLAAAEESIREMLNKASADGEKLATNIRMKAQAESEEIKDRAAKEIEASKDAAIRDFREYAADFATMAAEKIIRRNLNAADQAELVRQSLDQLQTVK